MTPAHAVAVQAFACLWCGATPIVYFERGTCDLRCRRCLEQGPQMTQQTQTQFVIDLEPAAAQTTEITRDASSALAYLRDQLLPSLDPLNDAHEAAVAQQIEAWASSAKQLDQQLAGWLALVKPIEKHARSIYSPGQKLCAQAIALAKAWLLDARRIKQQRVQAQLAAAAATSDPQELQQALAVSVQAPPGMRPVDVWSARVTDPAKVPAQYWMIDQARLDAEAKAAKGQGTPPPGVEWVHSERLDRTGR